MEHEISRIFFLHVKTLSLRSSPFFPVFLFLSLTNVFDIFPVFANFPYFRHFSRCSTFWESLSLQSQSPLTIAHLGGNDTSCCLLVPAFRVPGLREAYPVPLSLTTCSGSAVAIDTVSELPTARLYRRIAHLITPGNTTQKLSEDKDHHRGLT